MVSYPNSTICETTVDNYFPLPYGHDGDPMWRRYEMAMAYIVTPITSFVGIVGNAVNVIVLSKGNWNKSSTCLIFSLAVADTMHLLGANNVAMFLYSQGDIYGFKYTEAKATWAYYCFLAQVGVEITGKIASMFLPCLISLDRLIAVCLPLQYPIISTPRRVNVAISVTFMFAFAVFVLYALKFSFILTTSPVDNSTLVGLIIKSSLHCNHYFIYSSATSIISTLYGPVSVAFTLKVCIAVGVMVYLQSKKRKSLLGNRSNASELAERLTRKLPCFTCIACFRKEKVNDHLIEENELSTSTSESDIHRAKNVISNDGENAIKRPEISELNVKNLSDETSPSRSSSQCDVLKISKFELSRSCQNVVMNYPRNSKKLSIKSWKTTRTLLSVCIVYCIANTINYLVLLYFHTQHVTNRTAILVETSRKLVLVLNSACNFLFYVGLNRNFRQIFRRLFCCLCKEQGRS